MGRRSDGSRPVAIETFRTSVQPNITIVAVHSADGEIGLGETFYGAGSVEAYVHDVAAPLLARGATTSPAAVAHSLVGYVGYSGSGAETRANSAIDIALWDLLARRAGLPLRKVLGGPLRESIPVYNTCAGNSYVSTPSMVGSANWGVDASRGRATPARASGTGHAGVAPVGEPHEDLWAFLNEPGRLARELVDSGYGGMKVWPFDLAAEQSRGDQTADLRDGLRVLDKIREAVGDDIDIYVELHSLWGLRGAARLLRELERYGVVWAEDPIRPDRIQALSSLAAETSVPIAGGENLGAGSNAYKTLFDARALDVAIIDLGWSGGFTAGMKTAALADHYGIPVAAHDCTGPISLAAAVHFVTAIDNAFVQEVTRAFYHGWYTQIAEGLPVIEGGRISPAAAPGHGIRLTEEFLASPATTCLRTEL